MSISEQLEAEIDQAIEQSAEEVTEETSEETTVVSEGREEEVTVPTDEEKSEEVQKTSEDTQETDDTETQEDTQQETQEDTDQVELADTPEDSEENTPEQQTPEAGFSDTSLTRAVNAGLSLAEARSFGNEDALNAVSGRLEQQSQQYRTWAQEEQARHAQLQQQTVEEVDPFVDLKLNSDDYDPEIVAKFDQLTGIVRNQQELIQDFQSNQEQIQTNASNQGRAEIERWFDEEIAGLGEDFVEAVGSGGYNNLDRGSSQFANRDAIASQISVLISGYNAQGLSAPSRSDVFKMASRQVLSDKFAKIENDKLSNELGKQSKQHIQRANKTKASPVLSADEQDQEIADSIDRQFFGK